MAERPVTYEDVRSTCPICLQWLTDMTRIGDFENSYECDNGHWFYGKDTATVVDGLVMFPGAFRTEIMQEMNNAVHAIHQRRHRELITPNWLRSWLLRWLSNEEVAQLMEIIDVRRLARLSVLALEGWDYAR